VSDVLYENIRGAHHYEKVVDFRIVRSRWSKDEERCQIRTSHEHQLGVNL
jgi:hypothetical protein